MPIDKRGLFLLELDWVVAGFLTGMHSALPKAPRYRRGFFFDEGSEAAMSRRRDHLIDKKIGSMIRMQRVKLGMSQGELGKGLGVTFQQIQKDENGTNAMASTRIPDLCRILEISPNDLFGVSASA
jgi:DNA-binding XRE family transcriptional regulator